MEKIKTMLMSRDKETYTTAIAIIDSKLESVGINAEDLIYIIQRRQWEINYELYNSSGMMIPDPSRDIHIQRNE